MISVMNSSGIPRRKDRRVQDHTSGLRILYVRSASVVTPENKSHTCGKSDKRLLSTRKLLDPQAFIDFGVERDL